MSELTRSTPGEGYDADNPHPVNGGEAWSHRAMTGRKEQVR